MAFCRPPASNKGDSVGIPEKERPKMKATMILQAMVDDGAALELGAVVLPMLVTVATILSYLVG